MKIIYYSLIMFLVLTTSSLFSNKTSLQLFLSEFPHLKQPKKSEQIFNDPRFSYMVDNSKGPHVTNLDTAYDMIDTLDQQTIEQLAPAKNTTFKYKNLSHANPLAGTSRETLALDINTALKIIKLKFNELGNYQNDNAHKNRTVCIQGPYNIGNKNVNDIVEVAKQFEAQPYNLTLNPDKKTFSAQFYVPTQHHPQDFCDAVKNFDVIPSIQRSEQLNSTNITLQLLSAKKWELNFTRQSPSQNKYRRLGKKISIRYNPITRTAK